MSSVTFSFREEWNQQSNSMILEVFTNFNDSMIKIRQTN